LLGENKSDVEIGKILPRMSTAEQKLLMEKLFEYMGNSVNYWEQAEVQLDRAKQLTRGTLFGSVLSMQRNTEATNGALELNLDEQCNLITLPVGPDTHLGYVSLYIDGALSTLKRLGGLLSQATEKLVPKPIESEATATVSVHEPKVTTLKRQGEPTPNREMGQKQAKKSHNNADQLPVNSSAKQQQNRHNHRHSETAVDQHQMKWRENSTTKAKVKRSNTEIPPGMHQSEQRRKHSSKKTAKSSHLPDMAISKHSNSFEDWIMSSASNSR
ncbi:hypothetical protein Ciccas_012567, partial [Cichlidogyrus casuarinus]